MGVIHPSWDMNTTLREEEWGGPSMSQVGRNSLRIYEPSMSNSISFMIGGFCHLAFSCAIRRLHVH
jgi:hypothetical protein